MHIMNITQLKGSPCFLPLNIRIILLLFPFINSFAVSLEYRVLIYFMKFGPKPYFLRVLSIYPWSTESYNISMFLQY